MKEFYREQYDTITAQIKVVKAKVTELLTEPLTPISQSYIAHMQLFRLLSHLRKAQKIASESLVYECNKENAAERAKREAVKVPF